MLLHFHINRGDTRSMKFGSEKPNLMVRATEAHSPQPRLSVRPARHRERPHPVTWSSMGRSVLVTSRSVLGSRTSWPHERGRGRGAPLTSTLPPKGQASDPPGSYRADPSHPDCSEHDGEQARVGGQEPSTHPDAQAGDTLPAPPPGGWGNSSTKGPAVGHPVHRKREVMPARLLKKFLFTNYVKVTTSPFKTVKS